MSTRPDSDTSSDSGSERSSVEQATLERVRSLLQGLRYGTVTIVVQDGVVVQIERTEKVRLR